MTDEAIAEKAAIDLENRLYAKSIGDCSEEYIELEYEMKDGERIIYCPDNQVENKDFILCLADIFQSAIGEASEAKDAEIGALERSNQALRGVNTSRKDYNERLENKWDIKEKYLLVELRRIGVGYKTISYILNRTVSACQTQHINIQGCNSSTFSYRGLFPLLANFIVSHQKSLKNMFKED